MPDIDAQVLAPGGFVPSVAVAFGAKGAVATPVDGDHPLPVAFGSLAVDVRSAPPAAVATATIAAGTSLSPVVDLAGERLHRIVVPAGWTAAAISFQSSSSGTTFADLFDVSGEVTLSTSIVAGGRAIVVDPAVFLGVRYLRLRSGTSAGAVNQAADRALTLVTVPR
ncbi:hypothetical protein [Sphingomonas profundi]|uniref:hypothetical protein n=1 Tax=Alterirhizorhabdus profundi TaxID=2681549 RepID=UPI0012E8F714|nr:hypothetical protein [Sphingomonas profundi]